MELKIVLVGLHHHPKDGKDRMSASFDVYCPHDQTPIREELFLDHLMYAGILSTEVKCSKCGLPISLPHEPLRTFIHMQPGTAAIIQEVRAFTIEALPLNSPRHPTYWARAQLATLGDQVPAGEPGLPCRSCGKHVSQTWAAYHDNRCKECEDKALGRSQTEDPASKRCVKKNRLSCTGCDILEVCSEPRAAQSRAQGVE